MSDFASMTPEQRRASLHAGGLKCLFAGIGLCVLISPLFPGALILFLGVYLFFAVGARTCYTLTHWAEIKAEARHLDDQERAKQDFIANFYRRQAAKRAKAAPSRSYAVEDDELITPPPPPARQAQLQREIAELETRIAGCQRTLGRL